MKENLGGREVNWNAYGSLDTQLSSRPVKKIKKIRE